MNRAQQILRADRAAWRQERRERVRGEMEPDEVRCIMARIIRKKLELGEPIALDDFRLANLPMDLVQASFKAVLRITQNSIALEQQ